MPVFILAPAALMGCTFKRILENSGIAVRNLSVSSPCFAQSSAVASISKHVIGDIVGAAVQPRGEVHAEVLLRLMGEQIPLPNSHGDLEEAGFHALEHVRSLRP